MYDRSGAARSGADNEDGAVMIVHMIGNAHIDPVWLWRWPAGVDEALATFRSAADRCEEYPEFIFTRGEAWLYRQVEQLDPALFARVRRLVAAGQWHVTGGQWVQPDLNLPTADGLRRQFERGRRYFRDRFGVVPTVGYNVDSFGHPATLPDLLAALGYSGYVFSRPDPGQLELPAQTFRWRGVGGAEVLAFRITPIYATHVSDLYGQIMLAAEAADAGLGHAMCFYGVGNHGGGPTKANIEYILAHRHAFAGLELRFSTPAAYFEAVAPLTERLPVVGAELQRCFPGCYSVMHEIKAGQRRGEHRLAQAEALVAQLAAAEGAADGGPEADERDAAAGLAGRLAAGWDDLLFTQFHDVLAGTSIPSAWEGVRGLQGRGLLAAEEAVVAATRRWARRALPAANHQQVVALNPDAAPWQGFVEAEPPLDFDRWGDRWLSDEDGHPLPYQRIRAESPIMTRLLVPLHIAARGSTVVLVRDDAPPSVDAPDSDLVVSPHALANGRVHVALTNRGIGPVVVDGHTILGERGIALHLRRDDSNTWGMGADHFGGAIEAHFHGGEWIVDETGPLRAAAHLEGWINRTWVRWTLQLYRDDPRLHLILEITFNERFMLLQMPLHLVSAPERWTGGLAGGSAERVAGPTEWPLQCWSRLRVGNHDVALITDDAYSASLTGDCWQWTLLRSPEMAGILPTTDDPGRPAYHTDQGQHTFRFILHGDERLDDTALHRAAREQARPPIVFDRYEGLNRPPWGDSPPRYLWTAAIQRALVDGRLEHLRELQEE